MSETILQARTRLRISQTDLAKSLAINQAHISQIETGRRQPTAIQRHRLKLALGDNIIFPTEEITMHDKTPEMPQARWTNDGRPDFGHLDQEDKELQKAIETKTEKRLATANDRAKKAARVPDPPRPKWDRSGKPDFSDIDK